MNFRLFYAISLTLITLNCAHAQSFLKDGMHYSHARKLLLKNGWVPVDPYPNGKVSEVGTQEAELIKKGIREVDTCSMDAGALCNLFYIKNNSCLKVSTRGERLPYMRVIDWSAAPCCPDQIHPLPEAN